ncbi:CDP-archaeol synthase [Candidatus Woesearchaeota archaeon]|nr:CDP-archaeol synthase [Candidatus Woesearchaeota archaeon]
MSFFILSIIYFLFPAAFANMLPVFVKNNFKYLDYPVDFYFKIGKNRLFGNNKTFRGFIFGIIASIIVVFFQNLLYNYKFFQSLSLIDYSRSNFLILGFLIGFGTLFGDLIGSFIKRRLNYKPGEKFYVLDQINSAIGILIFVLPFYFNSWSVALWIIIVWFIGHLITKYLGYLLKIDKEKI